MIKTTNNKGFHMTFKNGNCISVQFGSMNYCDNRSLITFDFNSNKDTECKNCEIMIWNDITQLTITNEFIDCHGDEVIGYIEMDQLADIIYAVKNNMVSK